MISKLNITVASSKFSGNKKKIRGCNNNITIIIPSYYHPLPQGSELSNTSVTSSSPIILFTSLKMTQMKVSKMHIRHIPKMQILNIMRLFLASLWSTCCQVLRASRSPSLMLPFGPIRRKG